MSCKYCKEQRSVLNESTTDYSNIEITMITNPGQTSGIIRARSFEKGPGRFIEDQDAISINYCPFCGRKFSK